jgi:3-hydroxyacyl-CoA dehydrogenase
MNNMSKREIKTVAVIGAGVMGVGIVQTFASAGVEVKMIARNQERLEQSLASVKTNLELFQEFDLIDESPADILARVTIIPATDMLEATTGCDYAVETIPEVLDTKKAIFAQLDNLPDDVTIASNTSSFTVDTLTEGMKTPQRVVGLHYFNPAHIIPAVEIHKGKDTTDDVVAQTKALMIKTGKKPVIVRKTVPGFIINRLTGALEREVAYLIDEGIVTPEDLDIAVKSSYGFRLSCMGPMTQEDLIGLDTCARVSGNVFKLLSNRTDASPAVLEKVEKGELGIKSGKGWYDYSGQTRDEVNDKINRRLLKQLALFRSVEE